MSVENVVKVQGSGDGVVLRVENLVKHFQMRRSFTEALRGIPPKAVRAVDDVSFSVTKGEVYGVVGESGCGKTTMGRTVLRLIEPMSGKLYFNGKDILSFSADEMKKARRHMQLIFQDPYESMNPRMSVLRIIAEPLKIQGLISDPEEATEKVMQVLEDVELTPPEEYITRYPHELSGGQRQRIAIARALVLDPEFIVADEPVSMLDVSIRGEILNLMLRLAKERGVAFVYITHDLATARHICDRICVMYLGKMVEEADTETLVKKPLHPYTQALIGAVLVPDPQKRGIKIVMQGEVPNAANPPSGCRLHPRCPYVTDICKTQEPKLVEVAPGHRVACHLAAK